MGWNDTTKKFRYPFTKTADNGNGDFQKMVNSTKKTEVDLFKYGDWNKWAKFKYIKAPGVTEMNAATRIAKDQGFINISYTTAADCFNRAKASKVDWEYDRPTSATTASQISAFYPLRTFDFLNDTDKKSTSIDGYNGLAECAVSFYQSPQQYSGSFGNYFVFQIVWNYTSQEILFTDLKSINDYSNWKWCVLANVNGAVSSFDIYTDTTFSSSKIMTLGSPSSSRLVGYFRIPQTAWLAGEQEAYLGVYTTGHFIYAPLTRNVNFIVINPAANYIYEWARTDDMQQPTPRRQGLKITFASYNGMGRITNVSTKLTFIANKAVSTSMTYAVHMELRTLNYGTITYEETKNIPSMSQNDRYYFTMDWLIGSQDYYLINSLDEAFLSIKLVNGSNTFYLDPASIGMSNLESPVERSLAEIAELPTVMWEYTYV